MLAKELGQMFRGGNNALSNGGVVLGVELVRASHWNDAEDRLAGVPP